LNIYFPTYEIIALVALIGIILAAIKVLFLSDAAKDEFKRVATVAELPKELISEHPLSSYLGWETNLKTRVYFPDRVRSRHVHIVGATGSGKTESVLFNLIDQDARRGYPVVIVDAKGEEAFLNFLKTHPRIKDRLHIFDAGSTDHSVRYNPLAAGKSTAAVLRLFNAMIWSEEFYKTRARDTLMRLAEIQDSKNERVTLHWLKEVLSSAGSLAALLTTDTNPIKISENEYSQLSGLVSQVNQLCHGDLGDLISGKNKEREIDLGQAIQAQKIIYFKLPALEDPVTTATIGRLIIGDLALYAAQVQAGHYKGTFTPVFLDEFGSLVCPAFLELIAKARSAGLALHFSHQSMGDLRPAGENFVSQINDNSSTKIVLRVYDPDTADNIARMFGTVTTMKETRQMVTENFGNKKETGVMAVRDTREFRCNPDHVKTLPTGCAFVLMNHALRVDGNSSDVFRLRFPLPAKY